MNRTRLKVQLVKHEALRLKPYVDCCGRSWRDCTCTTKGNLTIGVGRNLDASGIFDCEVQLMLDNDVITAWHACQRLMPGFDTFSEPRQHAFIDMAFNLGEPRLAKFKKMLAAIEARDFETARKEMLDSAWAKQVGPRAQTLANMVWP